MHIEEVKLVYCSVIDVFDTFSDSLVCSFRAGLRIANYYRSECSAELVIDEQAEPYSAIFTETLTGKKKLCHISSNNFAEKAFAFVYYGAFRVLSEFGVTLIIFLIMIEMRNYLY